MHCAFAGIKVQEVVLATVSLLKSIWCIFECVWCCKKCMKCYWLSRTLYRRSYESSMNCLPMTLYLLTVPTE